MGGALTPLMTIVVNFMGTDAPLISPVISMIVLLCKASKCQGGGEEVVAILKARLFKTFEN